MGQRRHKKRNKKYIDTDENGNTTNHNICDVAKAVLRGKFIVINAHIRKEKKDFPGGPVVKTLRFQYRGHKFDPWLGN